MLYAQCYLFKYGIPAGTTWRRIPVESDASTITSMAFAFSAFLGNYGKKAKPMFIAAALCSVAFIAPFPRPPNHTIESTIIDALQHVSFVYATGFLIAGISFAIAPNVQISE